MGGDTGEGLTDEAIHIAAGMLFAGYGGVIGTMWSISDKLAPVMWRGIRVLVSKWHGTGSSGMLHERGTKPFGFFESGEFSVVCHMASIHPCRSLNTSSGGL
ncbi:hypothetical protein L210DRAFT_3548852 [Boletus edulis BED1]|uniref:Uncharacterized protein n=1 Tax=Boletus edulis BED1 TaxID=1328754 RepID=A0AAD4GC19_BOLED|nr:hypothetical protein L210DRAFT_3548852 [Boletus edulis BED1]